MVTQFTPANAPTPQQKWVRQTQAAINALEREIEIAKNGTKNSGSSTAGTLNRMQLQVADLREQAAKIQASVDYQASLVTVSADGGAYDSPSSPGDSTFRYSTGSPPVQVQLMAPTGRVLLQYGSGECRVVPPSNGIVSASVTFHMESPSGWSYDPTLSRGRITAYGGNALATPIAASTPVGGIPKNELITITLTYGIWSNAPADAGAAHYTSNYLVAQVIPA